MNAVVFDKVSKRLALPSDSSRSFRDTLISLSPLRQSPSGPEEFWALKDVSFEIQAGETVGFIGPNGAGKSSLLKLIARIFEPTSGQISVNGNVAALLELGTGFHPELTGRENIYLAAAIQGIDRAEVGKNLDSIVDFSGLGHFIDAPVKYYSSGMYVRLGFAVAIHTEPAILLIDEVLSVGDQRFQSRCMNRISTLKNQGVTIILVSHDLSAVRTTCQRCMWLEDGEIKCDGETDATLNAYLASVWSNGTGDDEPACPTLGQRWGSGEARVEHVYFLDRSEREKHAFRTGEHFRARIRYTCAEPLRRPSFGIAIYRDDGTHVTGPNTAVTGFEIPEIRGTGYVDYIIEDLPLLPGTYEFSATIYDYFSVHPYDHRHRQFPFRVVSETVSEKEGVVTVPCHWSHHQSNSTEPR